MLWLRTDKVNKQGQVVVSCRLTVAGKRAEITTNIKVRPEDWDGVRKRVKGSTSAARTANASLVKMQDQITDVWADLERQQRPVTAQSLARVYRANGSTLNLLDLCEAFTAERMGLVGLEIAAATLKCSTSRFNRLREFLKQVSMSELRPEEFTHSVADKFLHWLLTARGFGRSTANKVIQTMFQVLRWGVRREHLEKNPLDLYQYKIPTAKDIIYLEPSEVEMLSDHTFATESLTKVRDCFIFQCWTGLAYADLAALNVARDAETQENGRRFLRVTRAKSTLFKGFECVIPLLPEAERILAKYGDAIPIFTNQAYNRFLKQVGLIVGLGREKMTTHVGRKTAGTLMLNKGIPIEAVAKFLGHSSTKITQKLYAKLLDTTVLDAFSKAFGAPVPPSSTLNAAEGLGIDTGRVVSILRPAKRFAF